MLEEHIGENLCTLRVGKDFLGLWKTPTIKGKNWL